MYDKTVSLEEHVKNRINEERSKLYRFSNTVIGTATVYLVDNTQHLTTSMNDMASIENTANFITPFLISKDSKTIFILLTSYCVNVYMGDGVDEPTRLLIYNFINNLDYYDTTSVSVIGLHYSCTVPARYGNNWSGKKESYELVRSLEFMFKACVQVKELVFKSYS